MTALWRLILHCHSLLHRCCSAKWYSSQSLLRIGSFFLSLRRQLIFYPMLNLMFVSLLWMNTSMVLLFFSFSSAFLLIFSACIWKVGKTNQYGKGPPAPFNLTLRREGREITNYMKGSFKYTWKKHCGSEGLERQVLTRPSSAVHWVPLWTHGLLHNSVYRQVHRAEAYPKEEAL